MTALKNWLLALAILAAMSLSIGCGAEPECQDGDTKCPAEGYSLCIDGEWVLQAPYLCPSIPDVKETP